MGKLSFLKKGDILAETLSISVGGNATYQTYLGMLFTLAYLASLLAVAVTQLQAFADDSNPASVTDNFVSREQPVVDIFQHRLLPVFVAFNDITLIEAHDISKYFTLKTRKFIWEINEDTSIKETYEDIPVIPCKDLSDEMKEVYKHADDPSFKDLIQAGGMCINHTGALAVEGWGEDSDFALVNFQILPCSLSSGCKELKDLQLVNFQIGTPMIGYNASNYKEPFSVSLNMEDLYYIHPNIKQVYTSKIRYQKVVDLLGFFPDWKDRVEKYELTTPIAAAMYRPNMLQCTPAQVNDPKSDCKSYFEYFIQSSGMRIINKRSYQSFSETLGNIGGATQVVFVVLLMIYRPINENKRKKYIMEKVFPLINDKEFELNDDTIEDEINNESGNNKVMPFVDHSNVKEAVQIRDLPESETLFKKSDKINQRPFQEKSSGSSGSKKGFVLCCTKKKTQREKQMDKRLSQAFEKLDESLDVLNIVKESNTATMIADILLDQKQADLAQYIGFDLWRKEQIENKKKKKSKSSPSSNQKQISPSHESKSGSADQLSRFRDSLSCLQARATKSGEDIGSFRNNMKKLVDVFCVDHFTENSRRKLSYGVTDHLNGDVHRAKHFEVMKVESNRIAIDS